MFSKIRQEPCSWSDFGILELKTNSAHQLLFASLLCKVQGMCMLNSPLEAHLLQQPGVQVPVEGVREA